MSSRDQIGGSAGHSCRLDESLCDRAKRWDGGTTGGVARAGSVGYDDSQVASFASKRMLLKTLAQSRRTKRWTYRSNGKEKCSSAIVSSRLLHFAGAQEAHARSFQPVLPNSLSPPSPRAASSPALAKNAALSASKSPTTWIVSPKSSGSRHGPGGCAASSVRSRGR